MVEWNEENAAHLLSRAGFGGDARDLARYVRFGQATAVERLVGVTGVPVKGPGRSDNDSDDFAKLQTWWAKRMVKASARRLQEKMVLFWHDHFATSFDVVRNNLWMALQNRLFRLHGLGPFRTLVIEVTRDPAMLDFLDGRQSTKTKPNENFGRELMELFVLGVSDLNGVDNYTQTDVEELTRALTGFQIVDDAGVFVPSRFDGGSKSLFQLQPIASGNLGLVDAAGTPLPPSQNVVDVLFQHEDSDGTRTMPRYLAKKLWEYFAYPFAASSLTLAQQKARLDALTADFIAGGFVIADLLRAIFLHDDFYSPLAKAATVKNPCEYAIQAIRAFKARTDASTLPGHLEAMGMNLLDPPGVNGWSNGLPWVSSGQFLARLEFAQALAAGRDRTLKLVSSRLVDRDATTSAQVIDDLLARLRLTVPAGVRAELVAYLGTFATPDLDTWIERKVRGAIMLMLALPEAHIH
jgi:uncharacterized protein (DUF1800 family)